MIDPKRIAGSAAYFGWVVKNDGFFTEIQKGDIKLSLCNNSGAVVSESGHLLGVAEKVEDIQSLFASSFATNILRGDNDLTYEFLREINSDNISVITIAKADSPECMEMLLRRLVPATGKLKIDDSSDGSSTTLPCMFFKLVDYSHFDDLNAIPVAPIVVNISNFIDALAEASTPCVTILGDVDTIVPPPDIGLELLNMYTITMVDKYDQTISTRWIDDSHLLVDINNAISTKWKLEDSFIQPLPKSTVKIRERQLEDILAYQEDNQAYAMLSIIKLFREITISDFKNSVDRLVNFIDPESLKAYARERLLRE